MENWDDKKWRYSFLILEALKIIPHPSSFISQDSLERLSLSLKALYTLKTETLKLNLVIVLKMWLSRSGQLKPT